MTYTGTWAALPTSDLPALTPAPGSLVIHAGFPTQDQVEVMGNAAYVTAIEWLGPLDFVYLSSGAATSVERGLDVAHRTRVYGQAKLDDETASRRRSQPQGAASASSARLPCPART